MDVFSKTAGGSYYLFVSVESSVWGVVGVLFYSAGKFVLPFFIIYIIGVCAF